MHWQYGGWGGMGIIWIILIVVLVLGVVAFARAQNGRARPQEERARSAEELLKERYARGEIGEDEYEKKLRQLRR